MVSGLYGMERYNGRRHGNVRVESGRRDMEWNGVFFRKFLGDQLAGISVPFTAVKHMEWIAFTIPVILK